MTWKLVEPVPGPSQYGASEQVGDVDMAIITEEVEEDIVIQEDASEFDAEVEVEEIDEIYVSDEEPPADTNSVEIISLSLITIRTESDGINSVKRNIIFPRQSITIPGTGENSLVTWRRSCVGMLKPCGKGRPTCKNCSVNLKMTFNDFFFCFFLLLVTRELYDFSRELKKSNIFWYLHVYLAACKCGA